MTVTTRKTPVRKQTPKPVAAAAVAAVDADEAQQVTATVGGTEFVFDRSETPVGYELAMSML